MSDIKIQSLITHIYIDKTILILGIFNEIKDFNTESCEKITGKSPKSKKEKDY